MMEDENEKVLGFSGTKMVSTSEANEVKNVTRKRTGKLLGSRVGYESIFERRHHIQFRATRSGLMELAPKKKSNY